MDIYGCLYSIVFFLVSRLLLCFGALLSFCSSLDQVKAAALPPRTDQCITEEAWFVQLTMVSCLDTTSCGQVWVDSWIQADASPQDGACPIIWCWRLHDGVIRGACDSTVPPRCAAKMASAGEKATDPVQEYPEKPTNEFSW